MTRGTQPRPIRRAREWLSRISVLNAAAFLIGVGSMTWGVVLECRHAPRHAPLTLTGDLSATPGMCYDLPVGGWTPAQPRCYETIISVGPIVGNPWKGCR